MDYRIFNVRTHRCQRMRFHTGSYGHRERVCTESWLWEKNPSQHQGIEPASAAWRSDALPSEIQTHPTCTVKQCGKNNNSEPQKQVVDTRWTYIIPKTEGETFDLVDGRGGPVVVAMETQRAGCAVVVGEEIIEPDVGEVQRSVIGRESLHWSLSETRQASIVCLCLKHANSALFIDVCDTLIPALFIH